MITRRSLLSTLAVVCGSVFGLRPRRGAAKEAQLDTQSQGPPYPVWLLYRIRGACSHKEEIRKTDVGRSIKDLGVPQLMRWRHHTPPAPVDPYDGTVLQVEPLQRYSVDYYELTPRIARHERVAEEFIKANPEWECVKIDLSIPPRHPAAEDPGIPTTIPPGGITNDYE